MYDNILSPQVPSEYLVIVFIIYIYNLAEKFWEFDNGGKIMPYNFPPLLKLASCLLFASWLTNSTAHQ